MLIGYNTNGLAHHDGVQAIEVLADIGFQSIALTVDHLLLSPQAPRPAEQRATVRRLLADRGLHSVIESGARFLLDPRTKHHPTLLSQEPRDRRMTSTRTVLNLPPNWATVYRWSGSKPQTATIPIAGSIGGGPGPCRPPEVSSLISI
jgi:hypothetical protein